MGSLASRPKVTDVQPVQYIYVPPVTSTVTSAPAPTTSVNTGNMPTGTTTTPAPTEEEVKASARSQNLLERRRGGFSTILTSFRGLLNDTVNGARKTLLGE